MPPLAHDSESDEECLPRCKLSLGSQRFFWQQEILEFDVDKARCSARVCESLPTPGIFTHEELFDLLHAKSVYNHNLLQNLLTAESFETIRSSLSSVQTVFYWTLQRRNMIYQKMKVYNALYRVVSVFDERILIAKFSGDKSIFPDLPPSKCWYLHQFANSLKFKIMSEWVSHSKFRHHQKLFELLLHSDSKYVNPRWRHKVSHDPLKKCAIYALIDPFTRLIYVGKTIRTLQTRCIEHFRQIVNPRGCRQLPCYEVIRRHGFGGMLFVPLVMFDDIPDFQLRVLEQDFV